MPLLPCRKCGRRRQVEHEGVLAGLCNECADRVQVNNP
jgi:hypothetical protein